MYRIPPIEGKGQHVYKSLAKRNNKVMSALTSLYAGNCVKCLHLPYTAGSSEGWPV